MDQGRKGKRLITPGLIDLIFDVVDIAVIGGARDPYEAREIIIQQRPDVIILDVEMPRMDGITFLKKLQVHYPVPVIICSGVTEADGRVALEAIDSGAIDVVAKPKSGGSKALRRLGEDLAEKIHAAAVAMRPPPPIPVSATAQPTSFRAAGLDPHRHLVVIGASTGGTEAIKDVLSNVPADFPGTAIVQHMPEGFTKSFADRLNEFSAMTVTEAVDGEMLELGRAFVARGGIQMTVLPAAGKRRIAYGTDELVNRHCPSVDVLFKSAAVHARSRGIGIILTGMGNDGAQGLGEMRKAGALTVAQDRKSCVVYGMPKVAFDLGAVQHTAPPNMIPATALQAVQRDANPKAQPAARVGSSHGER
ncbi:MAG: chemotaxis-specific protein-glutamate methyltransferase CheB [Phycisphaerales bacterium]|nr:MAG: chemotaxis-specific protein-glutamate methyltransferase CheB [Phycisphaerales bacterium]